MGSQSSSYEDPGASLKEMIHSCRVRNDVQKAHFIPRDAIDFLRNKKCIERELVRLNLHEGDRAQVNATVDFIIHSAFITFLILTRLRVASRIPEFQRHGFGDEHLPIRITRIIGESSTYIETFSVETLSSGGRSFNSAKQVFLDPNSAWSKGFADIEEFCELQWSFLAPVINHKGFPARLSEKTILPIEKTDGLRTGGFSNVWKVLLHAEHHEPFQTVRLKTDRFPRGHKLMNSESHMVCS